MLPGIARYLQYLQGGGLLLFMGGGTLLFFTDKNPQN